MEVQCSVCAVNTGRDQYTLTTILRSVCILDRAVLTVRRPESHTLYIVKTLAGSQL